MQSSPDSRPFDGKYFGGFHQNPIFTCIFYKNRGPVTGRSDQTRKEANTAPVLAFQPLNARKVEGGMNWAREV
jgi:hypothetical protein